MSAVKKVWYQHVSTIPGVFRFVTAHLFLMLSCAVFCSFFYRTGKDGYIQIDGGAALHGQSKGRSLMVNTKGSIYLGE